MPLIPGDKLGAYEILGPLGAGGMGEVYRARDTRLDRDVAIKILPAAFANDAERLARFEREAKVLATLNHPNIAHIYGVEESLSARALVMELAPGTTLPRALPLHTALDYARQIAEALEAAHEKGITHRDLKPANIMVSPEGVVKVLDFGLATVPTREDAAAANSPTITMAATQAGMIMGTAAYMSPEQAAGRPVDRRADIWSFGVVLYEMLSGRQLFEGETVSHTLADVLRAPIDLDTLPPDTPPAIRDLLRRCLTRDPKKRLRDIGDARIVIEEALAGGPAASAPAAAPAKLSRLPLVFAAGAALAFAALAFVHFREQPPSPPPAVRFQVPVPLENKLFKNAPAGDNLALSPNGRILAFTTLSTDNQRIVWVRPLDVTEAHPLPATAGATGIFWSPDSRSIAFVAGRELKRVDIASGSAQTICALGGSFAGAAWAPSGVIVMGIRGNLLMRVAASGGVPEPLAPGDPEAASSVAGVPVFLPDGRHFLYLSWSPKNPDQFVRIASLDEKLALAAKPLFAIPYVSAMTFAPSADPHLGYILFEREDVLLAQPFDLRRLQIAGEPAVITQGTAIAGAGSISAANGVLAFRSGARTRTDSELLWFDRAGKQTGRLGAPAAYTNLRLSPDGKTVAADFNINQAFSHLSTAEVARGIFTGINPTQPADYAGVLSPDGRIVFTTGTDLYIQMVNGAGAPEPLLKSPTVKHANDWSLDGRYIVYDDHTNTKQDLWIVPLTGDRKPVPFLVTPADETDAAFSPDSHWIAYSSDESGRREVYVQGFLADRSPAAGIGKWRISAEGGAKPRWRRDGKELYFLSNAGEMMAVSVKSTPAAFEPGVPAVLFQTHARGYMPFDVGPDGRFLINSAGNEDTNILPITVILNWQEQRR